MADSIGTMRRECIRPFGLVDSRIKPRTPSRFCVPSASEYTSIPGCWTVSVEVGMALISLRMVNPESIALTMSSVVAVKPCTDWLRTCQNWSTAAEILRGRIPFCVSTSTIALTVGERGMYPIEAASSRSSLSISIDKTIRASLGEVVANVSTRSTTSISRGSTVSGASTTTGSIVAFDSPLATPSSRICPAPR